MTEHDESTGAARRATTRSRAASATKAAGTKAAKPKTTAAVRKRSTVATTSAKTTARKTTATKKIKKVSARATDGAAPSRTPVRRGNTSLVIVESPAKARTIAKYLGAGYRVQASMGHVRDLPKSKLGVDVESDFAPQYLISKDKTQVVKDLKSSVDSAKAVYLATDPDREGEAIAWHLIEATNPDPNRVHRVVFHEITPHAVREAIAQPRDIDRKLVDAYQARRVLDRLVGYKVSPLLWRTVKSGLSAGRVQTVALRLIVEREREIEAFEPVEYWSLEADLAKQTGRPHRKEDTFRAALSRINGQKADLKTGADADAVVAGLEGASYVVREVKTRATQRRPAAPFITSTLQQEASRKLGYGVRRTMQIAQELYEGVDLGPAGTTGLITYMRTDSTNVAAVAQHEARDVIGAKYGAEFVPERPSVYTRKAKGAQEAHEAIRPASVARDPEAVRPHLSNMQYRLYRLIWQRFVASQMRPALLDSTTVDIDAGRGLGTGAPSAQSTAPYTFRATGSVITFPGFLAVYREGRDDGADDELDKDALPPLTAGEPLDLLKLIPEQHFTQPPPRFTEASLVKALEEQGIGRPSTYAPTIATLQARSYVEVIEKRLQPTDLGRVVNDLLVKHFPAVFDVGFTSRMEEELDEIAAGERPWVPVLEAFYRPFAESLTQAEGTMERVKVPRPADEPTDEVCEQCGRPMVIKAGRFGKFIACTGFPECKNTKNIAQGTGVTCPKCRQHEIVVKRSRKGGRIFYGCNGYPTCDFTLWEKPLPTPCPVCGGLMVEAGKRGSGARCIACGNTSRTGSETRERTLVNAD